MCPARTARPGTVTVTGYSDDLVELDGAIRDEIDAWDTAIMLRFDNQAGVDRVLGEQP